MTKGLFISAYWTNKIFNQMSTEELQAVHAKYGDMKIRMMVALRDLRDQHSDLFKEKCHSYDVLNVRKWRNILQINLILWNMIQGTEHTPMLEWNDHIIACYDLLKPYMSETDINFMNYGYSVSDWSGNHLGIWGLYNNYMGFVDAAGYDSGEANKYRGYLESADEHMLTHRLGFFKMVSGTMRHQPAHQYWMDQAIWMMREIPIPRNSSFIDWSINPDYTPSPYPELLWKYKKAEASDRIQSLRVYPVFESTSSSYYWKDNPFKLHYAINWPNQTGIDFMIAYWFGRYHGVITPEM